MSYNFKFGGSALSEFYAFTTKRPPIEIAEYDGTRVSIPGKSGDEFLDNKRYKNVSMTREVGFVDRPGATPADLERAFIDWLAYLHGYQEFEDSDHPGMVTYAVLENFPEAQRELELIHKAKLKFSRVPFWYVKTGFEPLAVDMSAATPTLSIENLYPVGSEPIIVFNTTAGSPFVIGYSITAAGIQQNFEYLSVEGNITLTIDCEEYSAISNFSGGAAYKPYDVPEGFGVGQNVFQITAGADRISSIMITPRWRCLN